MSKRKTFLEGKLYKIRFLDHSVGSTDKMTIDAVGLCISDYEEHLVLSIWVVHTEDLDIKRDNLEPFSIIKSCITRTRKLS